MKILIKPFSEIMIKSKPVRRRHLNYLQNNLNLAIKQIDPLLKAHFSWDRGEVKCEKELSVFQQNMLEKTLQLTPGIESYLLVEQHDITDILSQDTDKIFDYIFQKTREVYESKVAWKSFAVRVKRAGTHSFSSLELERYIGGWFLEHTKVSWVSLKNPEIKVELEVRDRNLNIITKTQKTIGGYPIGCQEKVLSLISWGFDSWVSSFSMMKRWCKVDYLFFNLWGSAHEIGVKQVAQYLRKTIGAWYKASFITVDFEPVIAELLQKVESRYRGVILKRLFLDVASRISDEIGYMALVKGDSLGQVSSQTLANMHVIDQASTNLLFRPLIGMNKQEIIDISKQIGTYNFACNMPEYCGVISDNPATAAKMEKIVKQEAYINYDIVSQAVEDKKIIKIDQVIDNINENNIEIPVVHLVGDTDVVIDIREDEKRKKDPLKIEKVEILEIPFFEINHVFGDLDQTKNYLLYCEKGVLSNLHALYLKEKDFENVKIFRPISADSSCKI